MIKTFFMVFAYVYVSLCASVPLTDMDDVDQYIIKLKQALPDRAEQDCFFNLCDTGDCFGEIKFSHQIYYFVNKYYIAECPKECLGKILFGNVVMCDLRSSAREWFKNPSVLTYLDSGCNLKHAFHIDLSESPNRETALDANCMGMYKREPFLNALKEPVVVYDSLDLLREYEELAGKGGQLRLGVVPPVEEGMNERRRSSPCVFAMTRAQAAADSARRTLEARKRASRTVQAVLPPAPVVVEKVKPTPPMTVSTVQKETKRRTRKRKSTVGNSAAVSALDLQLASSSVGTATTIDSEEDLVREVKPSEEDLTKGSVEGVVSGVKPLMPQDIATMAEIAKGLTPEQLRAMQSEYEGRGMTFQQQYEQACSEGLFTTLRSLTPACSVSRSVSRSKGREVDAVRAPTPSSRTPSRARRVSQCEDFGRAPFLSFEVKYESLESESDYNNFLSNPPGQAVKSKLIELQEAIREGRFPNEGKFRSLCTKMLQVYKYSLGGKYRALYSLDVSSGTRILTFYGNPFVHYDD